MSVVHNLPGAATHVLVTSNQKIISLLPYNYTFATIMNCKYLLQGRLRGGDPQVEGHCFMWQVLV